MPAIQVSALTKHYRVYLREAGFAAALRSFWRRQYKAVEAVNAISFSMEAGEIVGFLGPNGAGKTTTLKMLSGLLHPTSGQATVLGDTPWLRRDAYLRQISLMMGQKNQLWWDVPAVDSFLINKEIYQVSDNDFQARLGMLSEMLDLGGLLKTPVRQLSLGERMKCELAGALLHAPRVLFLDEPTIGLDVTMQKRLRDFIRDYNRRTGATILLTSHYMDDIQALCERVIIIDHGRIIYDGRLAQIVERYADHRLLTASFKEPVLAESLAEIGQVTEFDPLRAVIRAPRAETTARAAMLLNHFPVADLTIEEIPVEDIIRRIFAGATSA
jgi:ABC-2 type transport system ATP-binding protein